MFLLIKNQMRGKMRYVGMFLSISILFLLCSCSETKSEYNLGVATDVNEILSDVELLLFPKGKHGGGFLNKQNTSWYMDIKHWPVPERIKVSFNNEKEQNHDLEIATRLKNNFRGDILIIIEKKNDKYYLTLKTGKLRELAFE